MLLVSSSEQVGVMISQSSRAERCALFMDGSMERDIPIPEGVDLPPV